MRARIERRSQGCLIRARSQVAWSDVVAGERLDVVTRDYPYNARPVCADASIEVWATLPPLAMVESLRRKWLVSEVERAALALRDPALREDAGCPTAGSAPAGLDGGPAADALDLIGCVAEGKGWRAHSSGKGALELAPGGRARSFAVVADGQDVAIELPIPLLAPANPGAALLAAGLHAVLALNARFAFARLRVAREPGALRVEHRLPAAQLHEDEIDYVLEGMRHAAAEAARTFETLRHPAVAQEYVAAHALAL